MFKPENLKKWILQDREKNHSQIDEEPKNEGLATDSLNRHQTWYALAYSSRIFAFSPGLLVRVRGIASNIQLNGSELSDEQYSSISYVAELAAIQSDVGLAEILANSILRSAEHLNKPADVAKLTTILVMASGAVANWSDSLTWAADRLVALAYRLPRGPCSEELAVWIEVMQRFIPLRERRWGKAWMIARSASL